MEDAGRAVVHMARGLMPVFSLSAYTVIMLRISRLYITFPGRRPCH